MRKFTETVCAAVAGVVLGLGVGASQSSAATLIGDEITLDRVIISPPYDFCAVAVGSAPCTTTVVAGSSDTVALSTGNNMYVDPEATSLIFTFGPRGGSGSGGGGDKIVIGDLNFGTGITGISYSTDLPGFSDSLISFTSDSVTILIDLLLWSGGQTLVVNLETVEPPTETPLPAALPLFATGLAGLGMVAGRRRRKHARH